MHLVISRRRKLDVFVFFVPSSRMKKTLSSESDRKEKGMQPAFVEKKLLFFKFYLELR